MTRLVPFLLPLLLSGGAIGCATAPSHTRSSSTQDLMIHYGCPTCHVIPGVPGAVGKVGPSLAGLEQRSYLAGVLPNTPENLEQWVMHPQSFQPGIAMPEMGVTPEAARRIADFLEKSAVM
jgi:cytochrome c